MQDLVKELSSKLKRIEEGNEEKNKTLKEKGKLTVRERISMLLDENSNSIEIGALATDDEQYPSAGVVVKVGSIQKRTCIVVANDSTVKAGSWFPMTVKKYLRAQELAIKNKIPIIYLVDSAGVYLPLQHQTFADKGHFGSVFKNSCYMSANGIPQIAAVMGPCVAGGAYLPILSDETIMVQNQGSIFLAGSALVKAAIGENIDNETLGGADTHCNISGVADYKVKDDYEAIELLKRIVNKITPNSKVNFNRVKPELPREDQTKLFEINKDKTMQDIIPVLKCLVDDSEFEEYKKDYGKTLVTAYARIDGWSVGIVANKRGVIKNSKGELKIGSVIYSDSANKASRFIANCNQKKIPIIFIQDVTGFMVGSKAEHGGIIKDGAKMLNMMSNSVVPKFTVIIGNSYGAGHYAMCSRAFDPTLILAWPSAKIGVMGSEKAINVLNQINKDKLDESSKKDYESKTSPYYAANNLWIDAIINPLETRKWISKGIEMADHNADLGEFKTGVIQV